MWMKSTLANIFNIVIFFVIFVICTGTAFVFAGNPPDAAQSSLVATSQGSNETFADGVTEASVTVTLRDASGIPLGGDIVTLSASTDATAIFSPTSATLDAMGIATFSATSTTAGTDPITATDTTTNTILLSLGQIIFDPVPTPTLTPTPTDIITVSPLPATGPGNLFISISFVGMLILLAGSLALIIL